MRARPGVLLSVLLAATLVGCLDDPSPYLKGVDNVPEDASSVVGKGDFPLRIRVVVEHVDGEAVPAAPILIFPIEKAYEAPSPHQLKNMNASYVLRTDEQGEATAHLIGGRTYSFIATAPGFTVEARHLERMAGKYRLEPLIIVLYKSTMELELTGTVTAGTTFAKLPFSPINCGGSLCNGRAAAYLQPIIFHPLEEYNAEYVSRMKRVEVTVTWTNAPPEYADLGVRGGFPPNLLWETDNSDTPAMAGRERLVVEMPYLAPGIRKKDPEFWAGPMTRQPVVTAGGLPYRMTVAADFDTDPVPLGNFYGPNRVFEPGFELVFAGLGLVGAGIWFRRR